MTTPPPCNINDSLRYPPSALRERTPPASHVLPPPRPPDPTHAHAPAPGHQSSFSFLFGDFCPDISIPTATEDVEGKAEPEAGDDDLSEIEFGDESLCRFLRTAQTPVVSDSPRKRPRGKREVSGDSSLKLERDLEEQEQQQQVQDEREHEHGMRTGPADRPRGHRCDEGGDGAVGEIGGKMSDFERERTMCEFEVGERADPGELRARFRDNGEDTELELALLLLQGDDDDDLEDENVEGEKSDCGRERASTLRRNPLLSLLIEDDDVDDDVEVREGSELDSCSGRPSRPPPLPLPQEPVVSRRQSKTATAAHRTGLRRDLPAAPEPFRDTESPEELLAALLDASTGIDEHLNPFPGLAGVVTHCPITPKRPPPKPQVAESNLDDEDDPSLHLRFCDKGMFSPMRKPSIDSFYSCRGSSMDEDAEETSPRSRPPPRGLRIVRGSMAQLEREMEELGRIKKDICSLDTKLRGFQTLPVTDEEDFQKWRRQRSAGIEPIERVRSKGHESHGGSRPLVNAPSTKTPLSSVGVQTQPSDSPFEKCRILEDNLRVFQRRNEQLRAENGSLKQEIAMLRQSSNRFGGDPQQQQVQIPPSEIDDDDFGREMDDELRALKQKLDLIEKGNVRLNVQLSQIKTQLDSPQQRKKRRSPTSSPAPSDSLESLDGFQRDFVMMSTHYDRFAEKYNHLLDRHARTRRLNQQYKRRIHEERKVRSDYKRRVKYLTRKLQALKREPVAIDRTPVCRKKKRPDHETRNTRKRDVPRNPTIEARIVRKRGVPKPPTIDLDKSEVPRRQKKRKYVTRIN